MDNKQSTYIRGWQRPANAGTAESALHGLAAATSGAEGLAAAGEPGHHARAVGGAVARSASGRTSAGHECGRAASQRADRDERDVKHPGVFLSFTNYPLTSSWDGN